MTRRIETDEVTVIGDIEELAALGDVVVVPEEGSDEAKLPKHAVMQEDGSVILPLRFPVALKYTSHAGGSPKEELYEQLHMKRLTGADMRAVSSAADGKRAVVAIARSCGIREGIMAVLYDKMDGADALAAGEVLGFFLNSGRATGR